MVRVDGREAATLRHITCGYVTYERVMSHTCHEPATITHVTNQPKSHMSRTSHYATLRHITFGYVTYERVMSHTCHEPATILRGLTARGPVAAATAPMIFVRYAT